MKINQESSEQYVPPRIKIMTVSTNSHILSGSYDVFGWDTGSSGIGDMSDEEEWWN